MKKLLVLSGIAALVLTACGGAKLAAPTEENVEVGQQAFAGTTLLELTHGYDLYQTHCGTCHSLHDPVNYTEDQWRSIVPKMVNQAINRRGAQISKADSEQILKYVVTMSNSGRQ